MSGCCEVARTESTALRTSSREKMIADAPDRYRSWKIFKITGTYTFDRVPGDWSDFGGVLRCLIDFVTFGLYLRSIRCCNRTSAKSRVSMVTRRHCFGVRCASERHDKWRQQYKHVLLYSIDNENANPMWRTHYISIVRGHSGARQTQISGRAEPGPAQLAEAGQGAADDAGGAAGRRGSNGYLSRNACEAEHPTRPSPIRGSIRPPSPA